MGILRRAVLGTQKMHKGPQNGMFLAFWKLIGFLWGAKTPYEINKHIVNIVFWIFSAGVFTPILLFFPLPPEIPYKTPKSLQNSKPLFDSVFDFWVQSALVDSVSTSLSMAATVLVCSLEPHWRSIRVSAIIRHLISHDLTINCPRLTILPKFFLVNYLGVPQVRRVIIWLAHTRQTHTHTKTQTHTETYANNYMCICIRIYIYMYIYVCVHKQTNRQTNTNTNTHTETERKTYEDTETHTHKKNKHTHTKTHTHKDTNKDTPTKTHTHTHTRKETHTHTRWHNHKDTHTQGRTLTYTHTHFCKKVVKPHAFQVLAQDHGSTNFVARFLSKGSC